MCDPVVDADRLSPSINIQVKLEVVDESETQKGNDTVKRETHGQRLRSRLSGGILAAVTIGLLALGSVAPPSPAHALDLDLPTWDDVQKAKNDESKSAKKVTEIEALIKQVETQVETTRQASEVASARLLETEEELMLAEQQVVAFEKQAVESAEEADEAAEQAAGLVSQMYRSGGVDRNLEMFLETDEVAADTLLERLALMEKATERNTSISEAAEQSKNSAASLGKQAEEARVERDRLRDEAEANRIAAAEAAEGARLELIEQEGQQRVLTEQLAALKDDTVKTVEGYEERLELEELERQRIAREAAEAERRRQEELQRQQAAEAKRIAEANAGNGGGGSPSVAAPAPAPAAPRPSAPRPSAPPSSGGWVRPLAGGYWVSTEFMGYYGHTGIDLAIGAGAPVYAASSGTVSASGWLGSTGYGYGVFIQHGGGMSTRYGHLLQPPNVGLGQYVQAGQVIGYVGSTGNSTGPHLHFETLSNGIPINPRNYIGNF